MYDHVCLKCNKEFTSKKKEQKYCSKSCANSVSTSNRKIEDISIFFGRIKCYKYLYIRVNLFRWLY